jgi:hypothetical protein
MAEQHKAVVLRGAAPQKADARLKANRKAQDKLAREADPDQVSILDVVGHYKAITSQRLVTGFMHVFEFIFELISKMPIYLHTIH